MNNFLYVKTHWKVIIFRILLLLSVGSYAASDLLPLVLKAADPIEIVATGQKNPLSKSGEVWICQINNSSASDSEALTPVGQGWQKKDGCWLASGITPSKMLYRGQVGEHVSLIFISHPWSGKIEIKIDGRTESFDLYSQTNTQKEIQITLQKLPKWMQVCAFIVGVFLAWYLTIHVEALVVKRFPGLKMRWVLLLWSVVVGIFFSVAWPINLALHYWADHAWLRWGLMVIVVGTVLEALILWAAKWPGLHTPVATRKDCIGAASLVFISGCLVLAAFYPGLMSLDSVTAWGQIAGKTAIIDYPAMHTIYMKLLSVGNSPASVALFQVVVLSGLVFLICDAVRKQGVSKLAVWLAGIAVGFSPVVMVMSVTHWRDVPYSLTLMILTWLMLLIINSKGEILNRYTFIIGLGLSLGLAALFRMNGIIVLLGLIILLMAIYRTAIRKLLWVSAIAVVTILIVKIAVYPIFNVIPSSIASQAGFAHHIAAHLNSGTKLDPDELEFLEKIKPIDQTAWMYNCAAANSVIFNNYDVEFGQKNQDKLSKIAVRLAIDDPITEIRHEVCVSDLVWKVVRDPQKISKYVFAIHTRADGFHYIDQNQFVNEKSFFSEGFTQSWLKSLFEMESPFLVRPAFYLYLLLGAFVISAIRLRSWQHGIVLAPVLLSSFSVALLTVAQDVRYQYPVFIAATMLAPILFLWPKMTLSQKNI